MPGKDFQSWHLNTKIMHTPLAKQAFENISKYKDLISTEQFNKMEAGIKNFDLSVTGFGFDAIQADHKLKAISTLTKEEFLEVSKSI